MGNSSKRDKRAIDRQVQMQRAVELRAKGLSLQQIGNHLGVVPSRVHQILRAALLQERERTHEAAQRWIDHELHNIAYDEDLAQRLVSKNNEEAAKNGDKDCAGIVLGVLQQKRGLRQERAKYLGLYAPEKQEHVVSAGNTPAEARRVMQELFGGDVRPAEPVDPVGQPGAESGAAKPRVDGGS